MWPKPLEPEIDPVAEIMNAWFGSIRGWKMALPPGYNTPRIRRTVTVLVEFNPELIDESELAQQVLHRLMPVQRTPGEGPSGVVWFGVRTHVWNSNIGWKATESNG